MRKTIAEIIRAARMNANPLGQVGFAEADALIANDVVKVVRCKDCAYANENGTTCHYGVGHYTSPMRYCSEGERKDGADNDL